jgi:Tol biopolymer transport system component
MNALEPGRRRTGASSNLLILVVALALGGGCATVGAGSPAGSEEKPSADEQKAMEALGGRVKGQIVWSSSRLGNHDLFVMNTDGSGVHPITSGENVDWFPRFSPDGSRILFTRSKKGWEFERDANTEGKWDIFTVTPDGKDITKIVDNASWGNWLSNDEIVYARGTRIYRRKLAGGDEELLVDSAKVPELDGALMQQPEMSRDGRFVAITLRGSKRETGIWSVEKKTWTRTGDGCQINWAPNNAEIYWVHPTGNGGSRVLHMPIQIGDDGKLGKSNADADPDALTLIDIPGRRSHEYFPQLSSDGKWLVWAATQRGHDHDIADYEIYLWEVGSKPESATRLTYHSGNDRWPDIFIAGSGRSDVAAPPSVKSDAGGASSKGGGAAASASTASPTPSSTTGDEAASGDGDSTGLVKAKAKSKAKPRKKAQAK